VTQFQWWLEESNVMNGVSILPFNPSVCLFTDASTSGWGARVGETLLQGVWTCEERSLHINNLEMLAVIRTVDLSEEVLRDHQVLLSTDNTTVVSNINCQGGVPSDLLILGHAADRPICNKIQQPSSDVCVSVSGRQSGRGRIGPRLERDVRVCIPADGVDPQNTAENQRVISKVSTDCSSMDI
jgi:hypothetical protein